MDLNSDKGKSVRSTREYTPMSLADSILKSYAFIDSPMQIDVPRPESEYIGLNELPDTMKEVINQMILKTNLKQVLNFLEPYYIIYNVESFLIPESDKIEKYVYAFNKIFENTELLNHVFEVVKFIDQKSVNGSIFVIQLKNARPDVSKLLIKVPKSEKTDPASYEFYVGLTLNKLRIKNVQNFSLVYGRFACGFDPSDPKGNLWSRLICDKKYPKRTYVLYEYIRSLNDEVIPLMTYIERLGSARVTKQEKKEIHTNLINILIMTMISLQHAQDELKFTHYDLHLKNVLVIKLNKTYEFTCQYKQTEYKIVLDYFPFIIDYGRSHVDPEAVDKSLEIYDSDKDMKYKNFKEYQDKIWLERGSMNIKEDTKREIYKNIDENLKNPNFQISIKNSLKRHYGERVSVRDIDREFILNKFYYKRQGVITHSITPSEFNSKYDLYKFTRSLCSTVLNYDKMGIWSYISEKLHEAYPFYIPRYYNLPKDYKSLNGMFEKPIDMAEYISRYFKILRETEESIQVEELKISQVKTGGGNETNENNIEDKSGQYIDNKEMFKEVHKLSKAEAEKIYRRYYKKMKKEKKEKKGIKKIIDFDTNEVINDSVDI